MMGTEPIEIKSLKQQLIEMGLKTEENEFLRQRIINAETEIQMLKRDIAFLKELINEHIGG